MSQIDTIILVNWIVAAFISFLFGAIGAWVTYRLNRKRDDLAWEREKKKIFDEWGHEKKLQEADFKQRLLELEMKYLKDEKQKLREQLLSGTDNPEVSAKKLVRSRAFIRQKMQVEILQEQMLDKEFSVETILQESPEIFLAMISDDVISEESLSLAISQLLRITGEEVTQTRIQEIMSSIQNLIDPRFLPIIQGKVSSSKSLSKNEPKESTEENVNP